jgi:hypothetical protein
VSSDIVVNLDQTDDNKVCVVSASTAWSFYRLTGAYVCQENRYFQEDTGRLGFYLSRLIQGAAPRIEAIFPSMSLDDGTASTLALSSNPTARRLGIAIDASLDQGLTDERVQVVLLTPLGHPDTATFEAVKHEGASAWTQRQRYAYLNQLERARTTEDLDAVDASGAAS